MRRILAAAFLTALVTTGVSWTGAPVRADESGRASAAVAPLDGRTFQTRIVRASIAGGGDEGQQEADKLVFSEGMFWSLLCRDFNFADAPYWVRRDGDRVHFQVELKSPTDGVMLWKGTIRGDTLEGTMRWTKKRWYWTIDTEHRIRGTIEKAASGARPVAN